ncbi:DUF6252 family protein [Desertivirga xinjiangensis]|uniref:DUF6252 family protein n=1 Tax=Desertivirga xinjiangensis TaxID=539206 RepID=UPI00210B29C3|nr:DUF6252 family protein [Pedobacter xinjiangensis]
MKKFTSAFLMLGLFAATLSSCKKDDDNKVDDEEDVKSTKMSFKVDGSQKTSTHLFAYKTDEDELGIYGSNSSEAVTVAIDNFHGVGDYVLEGDDDNNDDDGVMVLYTVGKESAAKLYYAEEATVKITSSNDKEVKGTFSATVKELNGDASMVLTEGKFEAKIVESMD